MEASSFIYDWVVNLPNMPEKPLAIKQNPCIAQGNVKVNSKPVALEGFIKK
jgi:hypothetical protein